MMYNGPQRNGLMTHQYFHLILNRVLAKNLGRIHSTKYASSTEIIIYNLPSLERSSLSGEQVWPIFFPWLRFCTTWHSTPLPSSYYCQELLTWWLLVASLTIKAETCEKVVQRIIHQYWYFHAQDTKQCNVINCI